MKRDTTSRDVADPGERFVVFKADPHVERQAAGGPLAAFDRETEELMAGADRAIAWFRNHGKRGAKVPLHPKRGGLAAAAKQRALLGKSESARNWVQGVRY